jgi:hypothetical protein
VTRGKTVCACGGPKDYLALRCRRCHVYRFGSHIDRFWMLVEKADGCWIWKGTIHSGTGYGLMQHDRKVYATHRLSLQIATGRPIPKGMHVCHRCDNPPCVNPDHLFIGTPRDNVRDMWAKGRAVIADRRWPRCKRGHEWTPDNTITRPAGRLCRLCKNARLREWRAKQQLQKVS